MRKEKTLQTAPPIVFEGEEKTADAYKTFFEGFHNDFIIIDHSLKASDISHWGVTEYFLVIIKRQKQLPCR